ncbi:methylmalonyl Co-A mutase-associated GTPase MeaB [Chloroflexota bacterium]
MRELVESMLAGDQRSLARLISIVEWESPQASQLMEAIYPYTGKAYRTGITGPPGGGKSTITGKLTSAAREKGLSVGIIAVDPTSPFSGGALLGDRIRMHQHYLDDNVFIRSMATRGSHGGIPRTASAVIQLLDAFGKDIIFIETVGVGQTELDIMKAVDATVVVLVPEAGDTIQTMKAGLMEIADIFAVNKADRPGADSLVAQLEIMLQYNTEKDWWQIPVLQTQAVNDIGTRELYGYIEQYYQVLKQSGKLNLKRQQQRKAELFQTIERKIMAEVTRSIESNGQLNSYLERLEAGEIDPYSAAREILGNQSLVESWLHGANKT